MTRRISSDSVVTGRGAPRPGDVLGGKYRIERELGNGGMGVVYEVSHLVMTNSRFAIKWLLPLENDRDGQRRFRREARISGAIRHPHVVEVYDVNLDEHGSYMVMELLEGESLAARIAREGPLPADEACRILIPCLSGVSAAHSAGVIHRDLKPANIFLCRGKELGEHLPKVLDFGVSRIVKAPKGVDTTQTQDTVVGTPMYMSPEQLQAAECDARSDIYSLGVTLYEMLAGRRPFTAASDLDLILKIATGSAVPLDQVVSTLPEGLSQVVMRAMRPSAHERFATVEELARALERFAQAQPPAAVPAPEPTAAPIAVRRMRFRSFVVGAAIAGLISTLAIWQSARERVERELTNRARDIEPAQHRANAESAMASPQFPGAATNTDTNAARDPAPIAPTAVQDVAHGASLPHGAPPQDRTRAGSVKPKRGKTETRLLAATEAGHRADSQSAATEVESPPNAGPMVASGLTLSPVSTPNPAPTTSKAPLRNAVPPPSRAPAPPPIEAPPAAPRPKPTPVLKSL